MALDSLKSSVSEYKDKKIDLTTQRDELTIEIEKADDLVSGASRLDESVQREIKKVRESFDVHEEELLEKSEQLEQERLDIKRQIDSEQQKLSTVQKKIDGLSGKKYTGGVDAVSKKCDDLLAELDDMLAEIEADGDGIGGATDTPGKSSNILKIDGDSYRVDDNGKPHMKRGEDKEYHVLPNTKYVVNGYTYQSDDKGRIIHVEGNLVVKDGERASLNAKVADMGDNDQRGHIIADIFGGSNQNDNLVAQLQPVNQGSYKILENCLADLSRSQNQVHGNYTIEYGDSSSRPSAITVNYSINEGVPMSQLDTFSKLGLQDTESFTEFENNLVALREQGHSVECNYSVVFSNDHDRCWLIVEHMVDGGYPISTQFL